MQDAYLVKSFKHKKGVLIHTTRYRSYKTNLQFIFSNVMEACYVRMIFTNAIQKIYKISNTK